jgi:glucose/arabinose dehydrogenase
MAFVPDGRMFYIELVTAQVRIIDPGWQVRPEIFYKFNVVETVGERGLLGIAVDPNFATNHYLYFYYSAQNPARNVIVRLKDVNNVGTEPTTIIDNIPQSTHHNAGNVGFGPDGKIYLSVGDARNPNGAQDRNFLGGKILRYNSDGSIPSDNPFAGSPVYALGLRNSFDFTFHPQTGGLWASENGPEVDDEVNLITSGGNYGWPIVTGVSTNASFTNPIIEFTPPIAPTGIVALGQGHAYGASFNNNLIMVDYVNGKVHRMVLGGTGLNTLGSHSVLFNGGEGALYDAVLGPDGFVYASGNTQIYKLVVAN